MDIAFWINAFVYASLVLLSMYLIGKNLSLRKYISDNSVAFLELSLQSKAKIDALQAEIQRRDNAAIEQTDGFVKFLSTSRDWAFSYIENVQQSIQSLKDATESGYNTEEELSKLFSLLPEKQQGEKNEQGND